MRLSNPSIDWGSAGVTLIVLAIVLFTGLQVATTITDEQIEQMEQQEEVTDVCMGVFGCGENLDEMVPVFAVIAVLSFAATYIVSLPRFPDGSGDVDDAKQLYIDGEITLLDLEERLEDDIDEDDL